MSKPNPTILIVPGSFAPPTIYQPVIDLLAKRGYPAVAVQLPSTQMRFPRPPATLEDDVDAIKRAAETLLGLGREIVVLAHSYGGTPTTAALSSPSLSSSIKRLIYLSAIVPRPGDSQISALSLPPSFLPAVTEGYMHMDALSFTSALLNDMPWETAYPLALQMPLHSRVSFDGVVGEVAYAKGVRVSYVLCEKDGIVSPEKQGEMIGRMEEVGVEVRVERLDSGHCPNWSAPEKLVDILVRSTEI